MPNEPVGVLIIGAGASAVAFAWSIAAAGMSVLCLEQGPWMKQSDYPTTTSTGSRAPPPSSRPTLTSDAKPPSTRHQDGTPTKPLIFKAVGRSTIL